MVIPTQAHYCSE